MRLLKLLIVLLLLSAAAPVEAAVQRFALVVGHNQGQAGDTPLRFAEADASKVAQVLRDLGGFEPADMVVLRHEDAGTVRRSLISLNDRIRAAASLPSTDTLLFVYYSGHADGQALRLGASRLEFRELAQLVRGSAAKFRVLVVDACRSGTLTRVKGGSIRAAFDVTESTLKGEGMAFLTASSESEDAQESDALGGSFFTHALVSGLLGAADRDGDGAVALEEAYRHAYDATLRATSRTYAGTQHPTFQYEVKGQGALVLTRPGRARANRATLAFPSGVSYLVLADSDRGRVVGEVGALDPARTLSVAPGKYFVRGRGPDFLLEGTLVAGAGEQHAIDARKLSRVQYARLVRKSGGEVGAVTAVEVGATARGSLSSDLRSCVGAALGTRRDFPGWALASRLGYCAAGFENRVLRERLHELEFDVAADHTWDFGRLSLALGGGLGGKLAYQRFTPADNAPARLSLAPLGFVLAGVSTPVLRRGFLGLDARLEGHLYRYQETAVEPVRLEAAAAARGAFVAGAYF